MKIRRFLLFFAALAMCLSTLLIVAFAQNAAEQNAAEATVTEPTTSQSVIATLSDDCTHDVVNEITGKCENCGFQYVASFGNAFYKTLADAFDAATDIGGSITLYADVELTSSLSVNGDGLWLTLNLNGKNLSGAPITVEKESVLCFMSNNLYDDACEGGSINLAVYGTLEMDTTEISPDLEIKLAVYSKSKVNLRGGHITKNIVLDSVTHDDLLCDGYCYRVYNDGVLGNLVKSTDDSLCNYDLAIEVCEHPGYSGSGICEYCNFEPVKLIKLTNVDNYYNGKKQFPDLVGTYIDSDFNQMSDSMIDGYNCTITADTSKENGAASAIYPGTYSSIVTLKGTYYDQWTVENWCILKASIDKKDEPAAITANIRNGRTNEYEVDLATLLPALDENCEYGNISYSITQYPNAENYVFDAIVSSSGVFTLNTDATNGDTEGALATIKVKVSTDNYKDFYFTINLFAADKMDAGVNITAPSNVKYGDLFTVTATKTAPDGGTWTWTIPNNKFEIVGEADKATVTLRAKECGALSLSVSYNGSDHEGADLCSFIVSQKAITKPAEDTTVYTYTGDEQTYSVADSSYYTVSGTKRTDAGSQKVVIALNDKDNYEWGDGTTDDIEYDFTVNKAKAVINADTTPIVVTYGDTVTLPTATTNFGTVTCDKTSADLVNANTYTVTYTVAGTDNYDGDTKTVSVTVNAKAITKPAEDTTVYTYTGDEQTYDVATSTLYTASGTKRTAAGSQKVVIALNDNVNYTWDDGKTDNVEYTFTINKAKADITVDTAPIVVTYGDTVTLPTATTNFGTVTCDKTSADLVNANTYTVTYTVAGTENYDGDTKTVSVTINAKAITKPAEDTTVYTYTGDEQTYSVADSSYYTVSGTKRTDAGSQKVVIALNDNVNYTWDDGKTDNVEYTFTINKAKADITVDTAPIVVTYGDTVTLPTATTNFGTVTCDKISADLVNANTYTVTYTVEGTDNYDGDTKTVSVTVNAKAITKPAEDTTVYTYTGDEQTYDVATSTLYTASGTKRTDAGSQKVVIALNDNVNYTWDDGKTDDIEYDFTVNKAKAVINADTTPIVVTYGDTVTLPTATTNFGTVACDKTSADLVNANTYIVTYTVAGTDNYDGDTKTLSVTVNPKSITKPTQDATVYTYTGDEQTYSVADSSYYTVSGTKRTDAGSQKVVIALNDNVNYTWDDGKTDNVEYTFTIKKAQPGRKIETVARIPVGETLENAQVEYGEFVATDGKTVLEGVFEWTNAKQKINESTTVTMRFTPNNDNYATIEFNVTITAYIPHSGNGISSTTTVKEGNIITVTTVNDDGSVTVTVKNTATGTTTETTTYTDGSMARLETRKDGTKISVKRDKNGDVAAEVQVTTEAEIKIPLLNAGEVTKIIVTDKNGRKTEITKFMITADGIKFTTSTSGSVKFVVGTAKKEFIDVHPIEHWATENIDYVYAKGLMMGTSEDTFEPDEPLTRGMAVAILYRAEGEPAVNKSKPFADVSAADYYANAVIWAQQNEIVNGVSENEFAPEERITREQFATMIYRYACYKGVAPTGAWAIRLTYADVAEISDYALEGVMYCKLKGIMNGKGENMFAPSDNTTRAEAAAIFHRFLEIGE